MAGIITPEQAAALLPILAKIAASPPTTDATTQGLPSYSFNMPSSGRSSSSLEPSPLSPTPNNPYSDGESSGYSASELLSKKKKRTHSSEAQKYMHVSYYGEH